MAFHLDLHSLPKYPLEVLRCQNSINLDQTAPSGAPPHLQTPLVGLHGNICAGVCIDLIYKIKIKIHSGSVLFKVDKATWDQVSFPIVYFSMIPYSVMLIHQVSVLSLYNDRM